MANSSPVFDYSFTQQLFCLSAASNAVGTRTGTQDVLQQEMQSVLPLALDSLGSDWEVVWGPAVYKKDPTVPTTGPVNAWYVAKSESAKIYVVAIAGTALYNFIAWTQDFNIKSVVDFKDWTIQWKVGSIPPPQAYQTSTDISRPLAASGTSNSTYYVLSSLSPEGAQSPNTLLGDFLSNNAQGYDVLFTGHSMGGAVAPTVALGLKESGLLPGAASVSVLASAGPTPGNAAFATAFETSFQPNVPPNIDYVNTDYYNSLDIVPQAFSTISGADRQFSNIPNTIYIDGVVVSEAAQELVDGAYNIVNTLDVKQSIPYAVLPGSKFTSPGIGQYPSPTPPQQLPLTTRSEVIQSIGYQHIGAYWYQLGITGYITYLGSLLQGRGLKDVDIEEAFAGIGLPTASAVE